MSEYGVVKMNHSVLFVFLLTLGVGCGTAGLVINKRHVLIKHARQVGPAQQLAIVGKFTLPDLAGNTGWQLEWVKTTANGSLVSSGNCTMRNN